MPTLEEKAAFAERLKFALQRSPEKISGATALALRFNLRHRGEHPISPQTAHKWLTGRTIPTPDKLRTLADWLRVDLHWLHYGPPPGAPAAKRQRRRDTTRNTRRRRRRSSWRRKSRRFRRIIAI